MERYQSNPILPNGGTGSWDEFFARDPCVLIDGSTWVMFYYGLDGKGKARDLLATAYLRSGFPGAVATLVISGSPSAGSNIGRLS